MTKPLIGRSPRVCPRQMAGNGLVHSPETSGIQYIQIWSTEVLRFLPDWGFLKQRGRQE